MERLRALDSPVAVDASLWDEPTTGIALYMHELTRALAAEGLCIQRIGARQSGDFPRGKEGRTAFTLFRLPGILSRSGAVLYHALCNFNLPLVRPRGKRLVLTVHDVIPEVLPNSVSTAFRWQFRLWLERSLKLADAVICVSEQTRKDVSNRFGISAHRCWVTPEGVDHVHRVPPPDATQRQTLASLGLPPNYLLYAGSLDVRKNLSAVLRALKVLKASKRDIPLVLVGQPWFGSAPAEFEVQKMQREGFDIRPLGYQPDSIFYEVMRKASLFVFPSRYEGFGLPPLEAMALGVPVVVSNAASLPEVCGPAAAYASPDDAEGLAAHIGRLWASPEERARRSEQGRVWAERFTWTRTAQATLDIYRSIL